MLLSNAKAVRGKLEGLYFQFNPTDIKHDGGRNFVTITSANMKPLLVASGYKPTTLSFELYFTDRYSKAYSNEVWKVIDFYRNKPEPLKLVLGKFFVGKVKILNAPTVIEEFDAEYKIVAFKVALDFQVVE